jgi:hypothetical protein
MVEGGGFEPPKAEPADLQSDPFGRSGTPPISGNTVLSFIWRLMSNNLICSSLLPYLQQPFGR